MRIESDRVVANFRARQHTLQPGYWCNGSITLSATSYEAGDSTYWAVTLQNCDVLS